MSYFKECREITVFQINNRKLLSIAQNNLLNWPNNVICAFTALGGDKAIELFKQPLNWAANSTNSLNILILIGISRTMNKQMNFSQKWLL